MPQTHLHFATALLPEGWRNNVRVTVADGRIESAAAGTDPSPGDEGHAIALPGMPNLHSHAFQRAMAGLAEHAAEDASGGNDDFWTWREAMYRVALFVSPDDVEAIAAELYVEMLEAGFTRVGEFHYLHHDIDGAPYGNIAEMAERIVAAAETSGIGLTLLPVFYDHSDFGAAPPNDGQRRFVNELDAFAKLFAASETAASKLDGANIGVAPHSLRAVTPEELTAVVAMSDGPIHIHAAEQVKEVEASLRVLGKRPVEWLLENTRVGPRWCLIHATHMTDTETQALAKSGATAGLCPVTEANLGDGIFNGRLYLEGAGSFGIGSDSNILVDPAAELRQLEYAQRLRDRARNRMWVDGKSTGRTLFDAALVGGVKALAQPASGLTVGASADIVTLRANHLMLEGRAGDALLDTWVFAARDSLIDCIWTRGVKRVSGGAHLARAPVRERFRKTMRKLATQPR